MPRTISHRKYQLTFNNPIDHDFGHDVIRNIVQNFSSCTYWCMCDEIGEQGTYHTHLYMAFPNPMEFTTMQTRFYGAHIEPAKGTHQQNRDYIRKEGKWLDDAKHETNKPETFEEFGELPPDRTKTESQAEQIVQMIRDGMTNAQILEQCPTAYNKMAHIEQARQTLLEERYKDTWRDLTVTYLWGDPGAGKTRSIMEKYGYSNVYRVTNYDSHPFDGYQGQDVIVFEEFRSGIKIQDMLNYLDGYPVNLPCRYANKVACYTKVYLISNIPLDKQYPNIQADSLETWSAFCRRIDPGSSFGNKGVF